MAPVPVDSMPLPAEAMLEPARYNPNPKAQAVPVTTLAVPFA